MRRYLFQLQKQKEAENKSGGQWTHFEVPTSYNSIATTSIITIFRPRDA